MHFWIKIFYKCILIFYPPNHSSEIGIGGINNWNLTSATRQPVTNFLIQRYLILNHNNLSVGGGGSLGGTRPVLFSFLVGGKMPILPSWGGQPGRMGIRIISQYFILCKNIFQSVWSYFVETLSELTILFL